MIGNETTSLILSGGLATISIRVSGTNGSTLPVYRSPDSSTPFTQIAICIVTGETCTFTTDHFSLFAVGAPLVPIVIPPTS